jgi:hypothetical protein
MRFRKTYSLIPGVKVNLTPNGLSTTIGKGPVSINTGSHGTFANVHIPGTPFWDRIKLNTKVGETLKDQITAIAQDCKGWFGFSMDTTAFLHRAHSLFSRVQTEWNEFVFPPSPFVISPAELEAFVDYGMSIAECVRWYVLSSGHAERFGSVIEEDFAIINNSLSDVRSGDVAALKQFHENIASFIRVQLRMFEDN